MIYEFVDDNLSMPISVADVAESCGLPRKRLNRRFKEALGFSLALYIIEQRIKCARRRLEGPVGQRRAMEHVADTCGYVDVDQFRRHFKRIVGQTPEEYQQAHAEPR